jgi:predicted dehydrogenase/nucleoside-diphosphate-sugar epimerase
MGKSTAPVRVGFLGTGYIADWHAQALKAIPGVNLVAVCDRDIARARSFGQRFGVTPAYASLEEMLSDRALELNAVHVLLPPDLHARTACTIIDAGLHVLLEKPMAISADECSEVIERARGRGMKLGVNHNFLFAPRYEQLRDDLALGRLGRPDLISIRWHRGLDQLQSGPFDLWMLRDPRNIVLEMGSHLVAFVLDLLGPQEIATARASNPVDLPGGRRFYRRWQIDLGGDVTRVALSLSLIQGFSEFGIDVRGSLASASVDFERNTYVLRRHTKYGIDYDRYRMTVNEAKALTSQARSTFGHYVLSKFKLSDKGSPYGLSITRTLRAFYADVSSATDPRLSGTLARDVIRLCTKIGAVAGVAAQCPPPAPAPSTPPAVRASPRAEILVLGATGFIGRELGRQLIGKGHAIRVLARNPGRLPDELRRPLVEVVAGDLTQPDDLKRALQGVRCVYHLARPMVKTWADFVAQDVEVTRQIGEACLTEGVKRLIYTGTIDSYYAGIKAGTITEETPLDPNIVRRNYYGRAKAAAEEILANLRCEKGLAVVVFRPGIVIGRGGSPFHWGVGMWSWNAVCRLWGQGRTPLPLVLVEDVAAALVAALDAEGIDGESFNLIANTDLTARDYITALQKSAGAAFEVIPTPPWTFYANDMAKWIVKVIVGHPDRKRRPSYRDWETRTQRAHYDCSKARKVLNWAPVDDRDEIIHRGIDLPVAEIFA